MTFRALKTLDMRDTRINNVASPIAAGDVIPMTAHDTYTPTMGDGTNNFTLSSATGHYNIIGNMCHVSFYAVWTSKGSASGTIRLSLPFTSATGPYSSMALSSSRGLTITTVGCINLSATNYVNFINTASNFTSLTATSFSTGGTICGSGFFYL